MFFESRESKIRSKLLISPHLMAHTQITHQVNRRKETTMMGTSRKNNLPIIAAGTFTNCSVHRLMKTTFADI